MPETQLRILGRGRDFKHRADETGVNAGRSGNCSDVIGAALPTACSRARESPAPTGCVCAPRAPARFECLGTIDQRDRGVPRFHGDLVDEPAGACGWVRIGVVVKGELNGLTAERLQVKGGAGPVGVGQVGERSERLPVARTGLDFDAMPGAWSGLKPMPESQPRIERRRRDNKDPVADQARISGGQVIVAEKSPAERLPR